jgi:hypothetical protein
MAAFATLSMACIEDVELARTPDGAVIADVVAPDVVAPDVIAPDVVLPDVVTPDASDARVDVPEEGGPDASTLLVQAVLTAQSETGMPREWQTEIEVTLTRAGSPVSGASVSWNSPLGSVTLVADDGHYRGARSGYPAWSELTVTTPGERPPTQRWSTPEAHMISAPRENESHAAMTPLDVTWTPTGATEAQITAPALLPAMADTGRATVPAVHFVRGAGALRVRVRRRTAATLGGFAPGSSARNDVIASVDVLVP